MMPHVLLYTSGCEEAPTKLATSVLGRNFFRARHFLRQSVFNQRFRHTVRALSAEQAAATKFFMRPALPLESHAAELAARWAAACQIRRRRQRFISRLVVAVPG